MIETNKILDIAKKAMEDKKGEKIRILNISSISTIADYFMIVSGNNINQVQAIADEIEDKLTEAGCEPKQVEGHRSGGWILMDYRDVVIHIFSSEERQFYDLERIWADAKVVEE